MSVTYYVYEKGIKAKMEVTMAKRPIRLDAPALTTIPSDRVRQSLQLMQIAYINAVAATDKSSASEFSAGICLAREKLSDFSRNTVEKVSA
jgi:hypothetical protein